MKTIHCERESEVITSLQSGLVNAECAAHIASCPACAETQHLSRLLLSHASHLRQHVLPPASGRVWRRANAQRQQAALRRATRGLRLMYLLGASYLLALSGRTLQIYLRMHAAEWMPAWAAISKTSLLGVIALLLFIGLGAAALLLLAASRNANPTLPT